MAPTGLAFGLGLALSLLAYRLVVLANTLGHATVALISSKGLVGVRVGRSPSVWRVRLGRLQLWLHPLPAQGEADGRATVYAELGRFAQIMFILAGPLAGCSAASLFVLLGVRSDLWVLVFAGCVLFFSELRNFWPAERRGEESAGAQLLKAIRTRPTVGSAEPIVAVETRWLVLITNPRRALGGRSRNLLLGVLAALDRQPTERGDEAQALVTVAFFGWCWREAERGDTTPIRSSVFDARRLAISRGMTGFDITAMAADALVRGEVDLAAASPFPESLEKGFPCARKNVSGGSSTEEQAWFAFRFGVALHDVVTIAG
jgi:hypothetical protein